MQLTSLSLALTRAGFLTFSPSALFAAGEQGAWYDPSDLTTLFQDSAGTTPVTAVEQPVGLMLDKSKGLVLGPELVTNGDFATDTWWLKDAGVTISGGTANWAATASTFQIYKPGILTVGKYYEATFTITSISSGGLRLNVGGNLGTVYTTPGTYTQRLTATSSQTLAVTSSGASTTASVDNVSFKELPGNHASQSTAASRPVLSARVNLLTKTEQFDDAAWIKQQVTAQTTTATTDPLGGTAAEILTATASTNFHRVFQTVSFTTNRVQMGCRLALKKGSHRYATVLSATDQGQGWLAATIDLDTGVITKTGVGTSSPAPILTSATSTNLGNGWYEVSIVGTPTPNTANRNFIVYLASSGTPVYGNTMAEDSWAATGTESIYIWGADLRYVNTGTNLPVYQRVNTSTDYDTVGFPLYLAFDGVDDWLQTNSINFTSTDKMTVFAGVRKLSDAAPGMIVELSANFNANSGTFYFDAPDDNLNRYLSIARGTAGGSLTQAATTGTTGVAPDTAVLSITHDIAGDLSTIRRNTVAGTSGTGDKGTGNFGNYQLFVGRRGGTTLPFNGRLYSLIVLGAQSTQQQISATESWVNGKTGAY